VTFAELNDMTKFAPIGPAHLLRKIREQLGEHVLGDYHLVLAHDIVHNRKEWEGSKVLPRGSTVIIDNSIIELGAPVEREMMEQAYGVLGDSYRRIIVLPDVFDDPLSTYENSCAYLEQMHSSPLLERAEYMFVIQASRLADYAEHSMKWRNLERMGVDWFSLPRRSTDRFGTRAFGLGHLLQFKTLRPDIKIHLLGFSNNVPDDLWCTRQTFVEGIDSAVPLRMGQKGEIFNVAMRGDQAGPRGTFWEDPHTVVHHRTRENLQLVRDTIKLPGRFPLNSYHPTLLPGAS